MFTLSDYNLTGDEKRVRQISLLRTEILHIDFLNYILFL